MKQKGLIRFETIVQDLVEGKIGRLFGGRLEPLDVASRLAQVMADSVNNGQGPSTFTISLNSEDYQFLIAANPNLADDISDAAWQIGRNAGDGRFDRPEIRLENDRLVRRHEVQISARNADTLTDEGGITVTISRNDGQPEPLAALLSLDAFLIIQGRRHVALNQPIITIGRRTENDIVIDMPSVSRRHAQVRWRFGRFVLYDTSTRGKTMVNGHPFVEHVLWPGDVIALSDALLVYGEGHEAQSPMPVDSGMENTKTFVRPSKT